MPLDGLVQRALSLQLIMDETAGIGGGRGNSEGSTSRNAAAHPLRPETTAAESRSVRDWEWI